MEEVNKEELAFLEGEKAAYLTIFNFCLRELGYKTPSLDSLTKDREAAIVILRRVCIEHGDNDWPANLNLAYIIEKHLEKHLDSEKHDFVPLLKPLERKNE